MDPSFKKLDQISNLHHRTVSMEVYRSNPAAGPVLFSLTLHSFNYTFPIIIIPFDKQIILYISKIKKQCIVPTELILMLSFG